jgi:thioredoxin reductase (NADPH)
MLRHQSCGEDVSPLYDVLVITSEELIAIPLFAELDADLLDFVARAVEDIRLLPGEFAGREGDERALFIIAEGVVELTKEVNGVERVVGKRYPGQVFGEVPIMLSTKLPASCGAVQASRVLKLDPTSVFALAARAPQVAATLGTLAQGRMKDLKEIAAERPTPDLTVTGAMMDPRVHVIGTFLSRNNVLFETVNVAMPQLPTVDTADGISLVAPSIREVARAAKLPVAPDHSDYDLVVVGAGPTGLTAAVNGAAEGLRTLVVERFAPGGQAGTSTRIENYTGFPFGVSGDELASKALRQARRLGGEIVVTRAVEAVDASSRILTLDGGEAITARVVLVATGVEWRRIPIDSIDRFVGSGVYYGAARSDARLTYGKDVQIIGAGNSAGQAAVFFSRHARSVTMIVRGESLGASMSQYLIDQIAENEQITVETRCEVVAVHGGDDLESIEVADRRAGTVTTRPAEVLFMMIGADAEAGWLPAEVALDADGYVLTGSRAKASGLWTADREPFALETTAPGIFAAGDVRSGSVKRVAAGVGEGGMAVAFAHQYLALAD